MANEDAKISRAGLLANFQGIIDDARRRLSHHAFQLGESHDFGGTSHKATVEAMVMDMEKHFQSMEHFLRGLP